SAGAGDDAVGPHASDPRLADAGGRRLDGRALCRGLAAPDRGVPPGHHLPQLARAGGACWPALHYRLLQPAAIPALSRTPGLYAMAAAGPSSPAAAPSPVRGAPGGPRLVEQ